MKKILVLLLALCLTLALVPALAQGDITIVSDKLWVINKEGRDSLVVYLALVKNNTDKDVSVDDAELTLTDKDGNTFDIEEDYGLKPSVLAANATGYYYLDQYVGRDKIGEVVSHKLNISVEPESYRSVKQLSTSKATAETRADSYSVEYTLMGPVTNDTDANLFDIQGVFIVKNADGEPIYVVSSDSGNAGLAPGGSMLLVAEPYAGLERLVEDGQVIGEIDLVAYRISYD